MAHGQAYQSNVKRIWKVFVILSVITGVEVWLGIVRPHFLVFNDVAGTHLLNWIFITLTLAKAYGIAWTFMHLEGEKKWFRRSIVWVAVFFVCYLMFILLVEAVYLHKVLLPWVRW